MTVRKLLLKNENGAPVAALTLKSEGKRTFLALPQDIVLLAAMSEGKILEAEKDGVLLSFSAKESPLSLLAMRRTEILFATEEKDAAYAKWKILSLQGENHEERRESAHEAPTPKEEEPPILRSEAAPEEKTENAEPLEAEREEENATSSEISEISEENDLMEETLETGKTEAASPAGKAREEIHALFEKGEPFPLFEEMIEGSHWVRLSDESLLGRITVDGEERLLCGVAGRRGAAPNEADDWTFLPTEEEEEEGYYIRAMRA